MARPSGRPKQAVRLGRVVRLLNRCRAAALLPDILEPADGPDHRKFFHSLTAAGLVAHAMSGKHTENYSEPACRLLAALGMGYLSHIALDCTTPAAIDLV